MTQRPISTLPSPSLISRLTVHWFTHTKYSGFNPELNMQKKKKKRHDDEGEGDHFTSL